MKRDDRLRYLVPATTLYEGLTRPTHSAAAEQACPNGNQSLRPRVVRPLPLPCNRAVLSVDRRRTCTPRSRRSTHHRRSRSLLCPTVAAATSALVTPGYLDARRCFATFPIAWTKSTARSHPRLAAASTPVLSLRRLRSVQERGCRRLLVCDLATRVRFAPDSPGPSLRGPRR